MEIKIKEVIAIDFDGTITEPSPYPITGKIRPEAIEVIKKLQNKYICCLWTNRYGSDLTQAIRLLRENGVVFEYINHSPYEGYSRKIRADYYIDDKAIGATIDWYEIERILLK